MEIVLDLLDRLARILDRIDPERREALRHALEHVALDDLATHEEEKLPGIAAVKEPDPTLRASSPDTAALLTALLPDFVTVTASRIDWRVRPRLFH